MAALQNYIRTQDPDLLRFAIERAAFLMALQDEDGSVRMSQVTASPTSGVAEVNGARRRREPFSPFGRRPWTTARTSFSSDPYYYWNIKSTENNESALHFFDMLYTITQEAAYKQTADRIYNWLKTMYDPAMHAFSRGAVFDGSQWIKDSFDHFATDTTSWAPLSRILADPFFGAGRQQRLEEVERMLQTVEENTGVYDGQDNLLGVSFSLGSADQDAISIEWSAQFALRYLQVASEYAALGDQEKNTEYSQKYQVLTDHISRYFKPARKSEPGARGRVAPYAVKPDGSIAVVDTEHGWTTSPAYAAAASLYFVFALKKFDLAVKAGFTE
jgi:hypothetical protein